MIETPPNSNNSTTPPKNRYPLILAGGAMVCLISMALTLYLLLTRETVNVTFTTSQEFATEIAVMQSQLSDTRTQIDLLVAIGGSVTTLLVAVNIGGLWLANRSYERDKEAIQTVMRAELVQRIEHESAQRVKASSEFAQQLESGLVSKEDHAASVSTISKEVIAQRDLLVETRANLRSSVEVIQQMQLQFTRERSTTQAEFNIARAQISNLEGSWPLTFSYLTNALEHISKSKEDEPRFLRIQIYLYANLAFNSHFEEILTDDSAKLLIAQFANAAQLHDPEGMRPLDRILFFVNKWKENVSEKS